MEVDLLVQDNRRSSDSLDARCRSLGGATASRVPEPVVGDPKNGPDGLSSGYAALDRSCQATSDSPFVRARRELEIDVS